ncbi:hypothetical protein PZ938_10275 [Luteipulveratus sp. YIM 133132]|uniref:hypothetical protein n=1 Tax=Luteipulveratus flavus TaxID=3031728 RepID=UPI0023AFD11F|nr:hypothetical protein [Luteipulveratus sp. YIM 133132]MDE9365989.1 hypothetical protein [Luteipulveratus sp. YIM 133132]
MKPRHAAPPSPRRAALTGALLGIAMAVSNVLSYLFVIVLAPALGPADFGGYSALSTYGILLAIPAGAFQVVVARHIAAGEHTSGLRPALVIGLGLAGATVLLAPLLRSAFHLDSLWAPVLLGLTLVPMTLTGAFQGTLLGLERVKGLSSLYILTAGGRLAAALVAALAGSSVTEVFGLLLAASAITSAWGWLLCRDAADRLPSSRAGLAAELLRSNTTLAAFMALTNVDVLLARHFLSAHESGGYALASTFGRAVCWATQFVALLLVPRMQSHGAARVRLKASGLVLAIGLVAFAVVALAPRFWIGLAGGEQYTDFAGLAVACVALGTAWALAQVWLFSEMGSNSSVLGGLTWVVLVVQAVTIGFWWHDSAGQIVAVCTAGALTVAVAGLALTVLAHQAERPLDQTSALAATDGTRT